MNKQSETYRILVIDNEPDSVERLLAALRALDSRDLGDAQSRRVEIVIVGSQEEADEAIAEAGLEGFPLILLDLEYPQTRGGNLVDANDEEYQGMKFLPELRRRQPYATIIVLSIFLSRQFAATLSKAIHDEYADDFLTKGTFPDPLVARIRLACQNAKENQERRALRTEFHASRRFRMYATFPEDVASLLNAAKAKLLRVADQIESGDPSSVAAAPAKIRGEVESLQHSLTQYTDLMASEGGKPESCDLGEMLRNMAILNEDRLAAAHARIVRPEGAVEVVRTYPADLRAALQEILENCADALEACVPGSAAHEVRIGLERREEDVRVVVTDTGGGFTDDAINRMFDAGFTTRSREQHQGLGLYVARRMMNAIGGEIYAHNSADKSGAEVILTLRDLGER